MVQGRCAGPWGRDVGGWVEGDRWFRVGCWWSRGGVLIVWENGVGGSGEVC